MKQKQIIEAIIKHRIIAIVRGASKDNILEIAEALYKGGIRLLEITFPYRMSDKYQQTSDMIQMVVKEFSDKLYVGAGTVMTTECVELAERAGAGFIISPDTNPDVIRKTKQLGLVSIPGAYTPTEIAKAISAGADFVKLFPAVSAGYSYIKSILSPLKGVRLIATGGIDAENCAEFIRCGCAGLGVGGKLVDLDAAARKQYWELTETAEKMVNKIREAE